MSQNAVKSSSWTSQDSVDSGRNWLEARGQGDRARQVSNLVETAVIPRLISAHSAEARETARESGPTKSVPLDAKAFGEIIISEDAEAAAAYIDLVRKAGASVESIYLELLQPTARYFGDLWVEDVLTFTDVTLAVSRLHQHLHALSPEFQRDGRSEQGRRALLVQAPGEQHMFGLMMLAEFFRRAGWSVAGGPGMSLNAIVECVTHERFAIIGFSLSTEDRIDTVAATIRHVRRASCNPAIRVLVGGQVFLDKPHLVAEVGADATASDGNQAVNEAEASLAAISRMH